MELRTTVRNFVKDAQDHHLAPETPIRVMIDEPETTTEPVRHKDIALPMMTPDEQKHRLNLMPRAYDPDASAELIAIIETSHTNTDMLDL